MNEAGIRHTGAYPDCYLSGRNCLKLVLHTAREDIRNAYVILFARTSPAKKQRILMKHLLRDAANDHFCTKAEFKSTVRYRKYYFELESTDGKRFFYNAYGVTEEEPEDGFFEFLYANETDVLKIPDWCKGQIYYQIFPERFCNADTSRNPANCMPWGTLPTRENYMGGDLRGITEKIHYLSELGVDCIYLNPIFLADFNHKYATSDYYEIDPQFGSKEDFKKLVDTVHACGMKIILDGVFNHTGIHFKAFDDLCKEQEKSEYKDWYYVTEYPVTVSEKCYECVGAYPYMPKLNTANPKVRDYILGVMRYWIAEFKIDGWRLDVADEVDESLWIFARRMLKDEFPDTLLLGETWGMGLRLLSGNQMDSIMNYTFWNAVKDFFAYEKIDAAELDFRLERMLSTYPQEINEAMFLVLDSHDTERFLCSCDGDMRKMKLAIMMQMCFVGAPSIYYGDEVGMTGDNDPGCRGCMPWEKNLQNEELQNYYRSLIALRKREKCLTSGSFAANLCEGRVFGFFRYMENEKVYVFFNAGEEAQKVKVPVFDKADYDNLLTGEIYSAEERTEGRYWNQDMWEYGAEVPITLNAYEGCIVKRRNLR